MFTVTTGSSTHRYDIAYDFMDDVPLPDWEPVQFAAAVTPPRTPSPPRQENDPAASKIYDGMAGIFIAESNEELALEYAAVANFILDNNELCMKFLIDHGPIRSALRAFSKRVQEDWPAAIGITFDMLALLDIINSDYSE
jgi:hypothetical protein